MGAVMVWITMEEGGGSGLSGEEGEVIWGLMMVVEEPPKNKLSQKKNVTRLLDEHSNFPANESHKMSQCRRKDYSYLSIDKIYSIYAYVSCTPTIEGIESL